MTQRISASLLNSLKPKNDRYRVWDSLVSGFGVTVHPSGKRVFMVTKSRFRGSNKRVTITIGTYGDPLTVEVARKQASALRAQLDQGIDPRETPDDQLTFSEYAERVMDQTAGRKKAKSVVIEKSLLARHILPRLGHKKMVEITARDITAFMKATAEPKEVVREQTKARGVAVVSGGAATANRAHDVVKAIFNHAIRDGIVTFNPTRPAQRYRLVKRERYLSVDELKALGKSLDAAGESGVNLYAVAAIRLLAISGARKNEVLSLKYSYLRPELGFAQLPDSKTGAKALRLSPDAWAIIESLPRLEGSDWVFPSLKSDGHLVGLQKIWDKIREEARIPDVRLHDLRHTFASFAVNAGHSLYIVGTSLGHARSSTTERYAHLADDPVSAAIADTSARISQHL
ncbi:MAG: tyrosine-type recombinase/integrase [Pseudomonadota bacterium]